MGGPREKIGVIDPWAELIGVLPSKPTLARLDWVYYVLGRARPGSKAFEHFDLPTLARLDWVYYVLGRARPGSKAFEFIELLLVELPVFPLTCKAKKHTAKNQRSSQPFLLCNHNSSF